MFMLVLTILIFGAASVCASDMNDTVVASDDDSAFELSQEDMESIDGININSRLRYDPDNCDFSIL